LIGWKGVLHPRMYPWPSLRRPRPSNRHCCWSV
jgi:hypothetical protein